MRKLSQTKFNYDTRFPMFNGNNWFVYNVKEKWQVVVGGSGGNNDSCVCLCVKYFFFSFRFLQWETLVRDWVNSTNHLSLCNRDERPTVQLIWNYENQPRYLLLLLFFFSLPLRQCWRAMWKYETNQLLPSTIYCPSVRCLKVSNDDIDSKSTTKWNVILLVLIAHERTHSSQKL